MEYIQMILGFGPAVVIPIIMFTFALLFGAKIADSAKNAMTVGIGFLGLSLLIGFMVNSLSTSTEAMVENLGLHYEVLDLGWPLISAFSLAALSLPIVYALCFVINLAMIATNTTKTLNVDFWNYWHFVFAAIIVEKLTGNFYLGVVGGVSTFIITIKIADYIAPRIQEFCETPNVTVTQAEIVAWAPLAFAMDKIVDKIPLINKVDINITTLEKKLGFFGSPLAMGAILGVLIALLGALPVDQVVKSGMNFAAVMVLLPTMAGVLVSGLVPITEAASEWVKKTFPNKSLYFGISGEITFKNPAVLSVGILMVPITILLSAILPGNTMMPFADIPYLPMFVVFGTVAANGNMFRGLINGIIIASCILWFGTDLAEITHNLAIDSNLEVPPTMLASSIDGGSHATSWIFFKLFEVMGSMNSFVSGMVVLLVSIALSYLIKFLFPSHKGEINKRNEEACPETEQTV